MSITACTCFGLSSGTLVPLECYVRFPDVATPSLSGWNSPVPEDGPPVLFKSGDQILYAAFVFMSVAYKDLGHWIATPDFG